MEVWSSIYSLINLAYSQTLTKTNVKSEEISFEKISTEDIILETYSKTKQYKEWMK